MKLNEPDKAAFDCHNSFADPFYEAQESRAQDFWDVLEKDDFQTASKDGNAKRTWQEIEKRHAAIRKSVLDFLGKYADDLAQKRIFRIPDRWYDKETWNNIKFIVAFDTSFDYTPDEFLDAHDDDDHSETDYLDGETSFRCDVVKACDRLALEGAALSKKIGSETYCLWADAMIKLESDYEEIQYKAVDDLLTALVRLWADLRTWNFMNPHHVAKKTTKKRKKSKK